MANQLVSDTVIQYLHDCMIKKGPFDLANAPGVVHDVVMQHRVYDCIMLTMAVLVSASMFVLSSYFKFTYEQAVITDSLLKEPYKKRYMFINTFGLYVIGVMFLYCTYLSFDLFGWVVYPRVRLLEYYDALLASDPQHHWTNTWQTPQK